MDYADGGNLRQYLNTHRNLKPLPEATVLDLFVQICLAVKHLHDRKVLHRDLKSENVFLTKGNMVKLGDFGMSKILLRTNELVNSYVGTP